MPVPLIDSFARRVKDLRVSITDRCNFRCAYCMPEEGMQWLPREELLTYEEIARIARVCVERFGFEAIRVTGGEPLVRAHVTRLVQLLAPLGVDIAMTTNGVRLPELAHDLADAGLRRINISLDSLQRERFFALTKRDELDRVLAGIDAALLAGLAPVKVNAVIMRGINDDEVVDLARFGRDKGVGVRFIEFMPLDAQGSGATRKSFPPARSSSASTRCSRSSRVIPIMSNPRSVTCSATVSATSVSSPASASRSATTATACASPPRDSSARVCSRSTRPISGPCCVGVAASTNPISTTDSRLPSKAQLPPSGPGTGSVRSTSYGPIGR